MRIGHPGCVIRHRHLDVPGVVPLEEQIEPGVIRPGDEPIERHRRACADLAHVTSDRASQKAIESPRYRPRGCSASLWCFTTVAAAMAFERSSERPRCRSLRLTCSYIRCSLSLTLGR